MLNYSQLLRSLFCFHNNPFNFSEYPNNSFYIRDSQTSPGVLNLVVRSRSVDTGHISFEFKMNENGEIDFINNNMHFNNFNAFLDHVATQLPSVEDNQSLSPIIKPVDIREIAAQLFNKELGDIPTEESLIAAAKKISDARVDSLAVRVSDSSPGCVVFMVKDADKIRQYRYLAGLPSGQLASFTDSKKKPRLSGIIGDVETEAYKQLGITGSARGWITESQYIQEINAQASADPKFFRAEKPFYGLPCNYLREHFPGRTITPCLDTITNFSNKWV